MSRHNRERRQKRREADIIVSASKERPVVLGPATIEDLQAEMPRIRAAYWEGVVNGSYADPLVFIIHNASDYAKRNGLTQGDTFLYHSVTRDGAVKMGLIADLPAPARPPMYEILLATADRVEYHLALNLTPSGVLDMLHTEPGRLGEITADHPEMAELLRKHPEFIEKPWLMDDGVGFQPTD